MGEGPEYVEDWATESLLAARAAYQVDGGRIKSGVKLGEAYMEARRPVVQRHLCLAGARPACVLNEALRE